MWFVLNTEVVDRSGLRGLGRRWGAIQRNALRDTAEHYHRRLFPRHFTPGNTSRYGHTPRSRFYRQVIKPFQGAGQGKFVDLQLKGTSRRAMVHLAKITATKNRATITMRPPNYFTNPFVGVLRGRGGKLKQIRRQPDKVAEVTRFNDQDRNDLQRYLERRLQTLLKQALASS